MSELINILGNKYGRLTVVGRGPNLKRRGSRWLCECECGNTCVVDSTSLRSGNTKSCGCLAIELVKKLTTKHGQAKKTKEYWSWRAMIGRCYYSCVENYVRYGGRGIKVCDRWRHSFENFFEDMGKKPTPHHTLDRYPDKTGDYEPNNCRWATIHEQASNRSNNKFVEYNGKSIMLADWIRLTGVKRHRYFYLIKYGYTLEEIIAKNKQLNLRHEK